AERPKAHAWKVCIRKTVSRVRIPPPPPRITYLILHRYLTFIGSDFRLFPEACRGCIFRTPRRDDFPAILCRFQSSSLEVDFRWYGRLRLHGPRQPSFGPHVSERGGNSAGEYNGLFVAEQACPLRRSIVWRG